MYTIGVMIGNAASPHTVDLMQGIYNEAQRKNVNVVFFLGIHSSYFYRDVFGSNGDKNYDYQFNTVYDYARMGDLDALIIAYGSLCIFLENSDKEAFLKRFEGIKRVMVEEYDDGQDASYIICDNHGGMYANMEHLIKDHHCKHFVYLSGPKDNTDAMERKKGFIDALVDYQIPFSEDMVEYGDYSEYVKPQIRALLDRYPDADAIVCANDSMAIAAYGVCEERGLRVGDDIAVTGYDDSLSAKTMDPPLTTVLQNAFEEGALGVQMAIDLCEGRKGRGHVCESTLVKRESCGCAREKLKFDEKELIIQYLDKAGNCAEIAEVFLKKCVRGNITPQIFAELKSSFTKKFQTDYDAGIKDAFDRKNTLISAEFAKEIFSGPYAKYLSVNAVMQCAFSMCHFMISRSDDPKKREEIFEAIQDVSLYLQKYTTKRGMNEVNSFRNDMWFMPLITRDMINNAEDEEAFYCGIMQKLRAIKTKSAYLFLLPQPVVHKHKKNWKFPKKLELVARHIGDEVHTFVENPPVITEKEGIMSLIRPDHQCSLFCYNVFNAERQYGILVGEIEPKDMLLLYFASMQIGPALRHHEISHMQKMTQNNLFDSLKLIEEKNKMLNFISEVDELTKCYNRRGFIERAIMLNKDNISKKAVLIFGDLDHLKEINDTFGHTEGDYAIQSVGRLFEEACIENSIIARLGGDEFVMMFLAESISAQETIAKIKQNYEKLNETSGKPYYVEISMGYTEFICGEDIVLGDLLKKADDTLYEAKKVRRKTICRQVIS